MQKPMLTAKEVAGVLRVTRQTVKKLIERGELEGFSSGKLTRVTPESLERLVQGKPNDQRPASSDHRSRGEGPTIPRPAVLSEASAPS